MVLPLLRITQGKKRAGGTGAWRERRGQSLELLFGEREQDLRKTEERERGNQELYKERWGARVHNRKEEFKKIICRQRKERESEEEKSDK